MTSFPVQLAILLPLVHTPCHSEVSFQEPITFEVVKGLMLEKTATVHKLDKACKGVSCICTGYDRPVCRLCVWCGHELWVVQDVKHQLLLW